MQVIAKERARPRSGFDFAAEFDSMLGSIDGRPRLAVDRDLKVIWRCEKAARLLAPPVPLQIEDNHLVADSRSATASLQDLIEHAATDCESVLLRGGDKRHWAMIVGWAPRAANDAVCLMLNLSIAHRSVAESGLARALRLTAAETRVLDHFANLSRPREIADLMNVSLSTVRSHLKQIHSKAGVETAVELTQLVRGYCSC